MSWREFQLRLIAFKRIEKRQHLLARQMTYSAGYALHVQKPKSIEQFWKIDLEQETETDAELYERMKKAMEREWAKIRNLN